MPFVYTAPTSGSTSSSPPDLTSVFIPFSFFLTFSKLDWNCLFHDLRRFISQASSMEISPLIGLNFMVASVMKDEILLKQIDDSPHLPAHAIEYNIEVLEVIFADIASLYLRTPYDANLKLQRIVRGASGLNATISAGMFPSHDHALINIHQYLH